jgi:hypothetical protein
MILSAFPAALNTVPTFGQKDFDQFPPLTFGGQPVQISFLAASALVPYVATVLIGVSAATILAVATALTACGVTAKVLYDNRDRFAATFTQINQAFQRGERNPVAFINIVFKSMTGLSTHDRTAMGVPSIKPNTFPNPSPQKFLPPGGHREEPRNQVYTTPIQRSGKKPTAPKRPEAAEVTYVFSSRKSPTQLTMEHKEQILQIVSLGHLD